MQISVNDNLIIIGQYLNWVVFDWFSVCPAGFTGGYCQVNIDDCPSALCHHYSTCIDLIHNYSCSCGPRWTGRLCDNFLGSLCNKTINNNIDVCKNGGLCFDTDDKNNYTCTCADGFTGRNCELEFDPCDSSPCKQGGNCSKLGLGDFKCDCPIGETLIKQNSLKYIILLLGFFVFH